MRASRASTQKAAELGYVLVAETQYSHNEAVDGCLDHQRAAGRQTRISPVVFASNLFTAQGVATGVKQAGATEVQVVGFDAGPDQIMQLQAGDVQALVAQQPFDHRPDGRRAGRWPR